LSRPYFFEQAGHAVQSQQQHVSQSQLPEMQQPQQAACASFAFTIFTTGPAAMSTAAAAMYNNFIMLNKKLTKLSRPR
jgi:hypothetical protein